MARPRVLVADNHLPLLNAATALLRIDFDVVGTATDGEMLVAEALRLRPNVIVADITMPGMNGIDAIRQLRKSDLRVSAVFLTVYSEVEFLEICLAEGALGYVLKTRMKSHLIPAVRAALAGRSYISPLG